MTTKILVVDDSLVERLLVEGLLRANAEYEVTLAEHGEQALEIMTSTPYDLVITDLMMPEMNGLELVREVRQRHPDVPVILMTAYGDETTAIEALEAGAASYLSKAQKAERLRATVERVVKKATSDQIHQQLVQCLLESRCRYALPNDRLLIRAVVDQVQQTMAGMGFTNTVERIRVGEALEEAMLNAMYHGNLELSQAELAKVRGELDEHLLDRLIEERCREPRFRERKILVIAHLTPAEARFVIRDQGRGFNTMYVVDESKSQQGEFPGGRGLTLIRSLMDEVKYNEAGNELVMRKLHQGGNESETPEAVSLAD